MELENQLQQAYQLIKTGQRQEAVNLLKEILQAAPDSDAAWTLMGHALINADQKIKAFQKALAINPDNQKAQQGLDKVTQKGTRPKKAAVKKERKVSNGAIFFIATSIGIVFIGLSIAAIWFYFIRDNTSTASANENTVVEPTFEADAAAQVDEQPAGNNLLPGTWTPTAYVEPTMTLTPVPTATLPPTNTPAPYLSPTPDIPPTAEGYFEDSGEEGFEDFGDALEEAFEAMFAIFNADTETLAALEQGLKQTDSVEDATEYYMVLFLLSAFQAEDEASMEALLLEQSTLLTNKMNALLPTLNSTAEIARAYLMLMTGESLTMDPENLTESDTAARTLDALLPLVDDLQRVEDQIAVSGALAFAYTLQGDWELAESYTINPGIDLKDRWDSFDTISDIVYAYNFILGNSGMGTMMDVEDDVLNPEFLPYTRDVQERLPAMIETSINAEELVLAYNTLAKIAMAEGDSETAKTYFVQEVFLAENADVESYLDLATIYSEQGEEGCAYKLYGFALETESAFTILFKGFIELAIEDIEGRYSSGIPACGDF